MIPPLALPPGRCACWPVSAMSSVGQPVLVGVPGAPIAHFRRPGRLDTCCPALRKCSWSATGAPSPPPLVHLRVQGRPQGPGPASESGHRPHRCQIPGLPARRSRRAGCPFRCGARPAGGQPVRGMIGGGEGDAPTSESLTAIGWAAARVPCRRWSGPGRECGTGTWSFSWVCAADRCGRRRGRAGLPPGHDRLARSTRRGDQ